MRGSGPQTFKLVEELSLTLSHVKALHALAEREEPSVKDLAEPLCLSLPATSRLVDVLLKRGLVTRREDEEDRRSRRVAITEEGRDVLRRINAARLAGLEQFVQELTPEEREALHTTLSPIVARLENE